MASRGVTAPPKPKPSGRVFPVTFQDAAARAGLARPAVSGGVRSRYIVEAMGTGAAFLDYDGDGWIDIFLVSGSRFEDSPAKAGASNRLYRNNHDGAFTDVTVKAGLFHQGWGQSAAAADFDNDGLTDLFVTYWGRNVLYRNRGGVFEDVTAQAGLSGDADRWGSGASFFDYDRDGDLDLFLANYLTLDPRTVPPAGKDLACAWLGTPVFCGPRGLPFARNWLYRNNGNGAFTGVSEESGAGTRFDTYALGVLAADMDGDAWPDLYVAGDSTRSLFLHNNGDGTFEERGVYLGLAYDETGQEQAGMGVALGDYDGDGLLDIAKTNFSDDYPNLYRNLGAQGYTDRALHAGLGVNPQYVLWSAIFADFDNDAWPDLFFSAGHVFTEARAYRNPQQLYWNLGGGKFEDVGTRAGPGIAAPRSSRGAAVGDFDNDGDPDLLIVNMNEAPSLLRNDNKSGNAWIQVALKGTRSNRDAIGARVGVTAGGRVLTGVKLSQSGYYSVNDPRLHFGLGAARAIDAIEVTWPSGGVETWRGVPPNRVFEAVEGSAPR